LPSLDLRFGRIRRAARAAAAAAPQPSSRPAAGAPPNVPAGV
jgi:hypothetical protein